MGSEWTLLRFGHGSSDRDGVGVPLRLSTKLANPPKAESAHEEPTGGNHNNNDNTNQKQQ